MPIFFKRQKLNKKEKSKLDKYAGQWIAIKGKDEVVSHGQTIEEIIEEVKVKDKNIEDELPDPREETVAMKLPGKEKV